MSVRNAVTDLNCDGSVLLGRGRSRRAGLGLAVVFLDVFRFLFEVLHDYGDSTIRCVERLSGGAQHLIGVASDLRNLVRSQTVVLHQAAGGVGTVGRKLPIAIFTAAGVGLGIGVTFDRKMIGNFPQFPGQQREQLFAVIAGRRVAYLKEGSGFGLEQFDAQAFGGYGHLDLVFDFVKIWDLADGLLQFFFQFRHVVLGYSEGLGSAYFNGAHFVGGSGRVFEIAGYGFLYRLAGVEKPEHDEERHHRRHEVGVGDLPGAAVMSAVSAFFFDDDDGT